MSGSGNGNGATGRDQSRPLGYKQRAKRDAAALVLQDALRLLSDAGPAVDQLLRNHLTRDGVRERAALVKARQGEIEKALLRALVVLQSMDDRTPIELDALLGE